MIKIIVSPFPHDIGRPNAKNYPHWQKLIDLLKENDFFITQIGIKNEKRFKNVDFYYFDKKLIELEELIKANDTWISVDNFFQHLNNAKIKKPGFVLYSRSDPRLFGYDHNHNLLRNIKFLRADQYGVWHNCPAIPQSYLSPEFVLKLIKERLKKNE